MYYLLSQFANQQGLDIAESTTSATGYPQSLRYCLFGFESIEDAEEVASSIQKEINKEFEDVDIIIRYFRKKNGWHLWQREGRAFHMYEMTIELEDNQVPYYKNDAESWLEERAEMILDEDYLDRLGIDVETFNNNTQKVYVALKNLKDGSFLIIDNYSWEDGYFEIIQERAMGYIQDSWTHEIGISIE